MYVIAFLLISFNLHLTEACDNYTVNITAVGRRSSDEFVWTSGEDIVIAVNFICITGLNNSSLYVFSLKRKEESNSGYGNYIMYVQYYGSTSDDNYNYHRNISYTFRSFRYGFNVNFTYGNATTDVNGSRLVVLDYYQGGIIIGLQEVTVKSWQTDCQVENIPEHLHPKTTTQKNFNYLETISVSCANGSIFKNNSAGFSIALLDSQLVCMERGRWGNVECHKSCAASDLNSDLTLRHINMNSSHYKTGTNLQLVCKEGLMTSEKANEYVINKTIASCREVWKVDDVNCWKGQYTDIFAETSNQRQFLTDQQILMFCKKSDGGTKLSFRKTEEISQTSARKYLTLTSKDHGSRIICQRITDNNVTQRTEVLLNVLYPPETTSTQYIFELSNGTSGRVIIQFQANPQLSRKDVKVQFKGDAITNYYLKVNGVKHEIVIDYTVVQENDFGDYVITLTSQPPVESTLELNVAVQPKQAEIIVTSTIKTKDVATTIPKEPQESSQQQDPTAITVLSVSLVVALALLAWQLFLRYGDRSILLKRISTLRNYFTRSAGSNRANGSANTQDPEEPHDYEDIDNNTVDNAGAYESTVIQNGAQTESGYIDMTINPSSSNQPISQPPSAYEDINTKFSDHGQNNYEDWK